MNRYEQEYMRDKVARLAAKSLSEGRAYRLNPPDILHWHVPRPEWRHSEYKQVARALAYVGRIAPQRVEQLLEKAAATDSLQELPTESEVSFYAKMRQGHLELFVGPSSLIKLGRPVRFGS